jgi:hypothetical protein
MRFRLVIQILVVVCLFAFVSSKAWSELVIKVTQGNDTPSIIAIPPIVLKGGQLSEDVSAIIEADLERSGFLKSLIGTICLHFHLLRMISIFVIGGCLVVSISWLGVLQRFRDQDSN